MDHERGGFIPVHTRWTAPQFPHLHSTVGLGVFQRRRPRGHPFNKRRWNDLEGLLRKGGHCCHQSQIRRMRSIHHAVYSSNCSAAIPPQLSQAPRLSEGTA